MKAIILKNTVSILAVFVTDLIITDKDKSNLQDIADHYMQEIVIKDVTTGWFNGSKIGRTSVDDMITMVRSLNGD